MTLKHIKFDESQTMRSLERVAIKKGLLKPKEIVKEAQVNLATSDNLYSDLVGLANGLRQRGFMKEAESLEDKIHRVKLAETHLYRAIDEDGQDLLDFAHPDGDVRVSDSPYGVVETIDSAHSKMIDMVAKKPTGKYASSVRDLIIATADILEVFPLKKQAQEIGVLGDRSPEQIVADEEEQIAAATLPQETKLKMDQANNVIDAAWEGLNAKVSAALKAFPAVEFTESSLLSGVGADYYSELIGMPGAAKILGELKKTSEVLGVDGEVTKEGILEKFRSRTNNPNALYQFVRSFAPWLANHRFKGAQWKNDKPTGDTIDNIMYKGKNDNSVYVVFWSSDIAHSEASVDGGTLAAAAQEAYDYEYVAKKNQVFGEGGSFLATASSTATEQVDKVKKAIAEDLNNKFFNHKQYVSATNPTTGLADGLILDFIKTVSTHFTSIPKNLMPIYTASGQSKEYVIAQQTFTFLMNEAAGYHKQLSSIQIDPELDVPKKNELAQIRARFSQAITKLQKYKKENQGSLNDKQLSIIDNNSKIIAGAINAMKNDVISKPYAVVLEALKTSAPSVAADAPSIAELASIAEEAVAIAYSMAGEEVPEANPEFGKLISKSSHDFKLVKQAKGGLTGGTPAPKNPKGGPKGTPAPSGGAATPPSSTVPSLAKFDSNSPDQKAVANMQLALNNFGRLISSEATKAKFPKLTNYDTTDGLKIIGTGPKSNPHLNMFDGKWGPNTDTALTLAEKYLSSLGLDLATGVKWNSSTRAHAEGTADAANNNAVILNRANAYLGGQTGLPTDATLDTLPQNINWSPEGAAASSGEIKLLKSDLGSLAALYNFLTKNGLRTPETTGLTIESGSTEGFSYKTWNEILTWFPTRARHLFETAKAANDGPSLAKSREYYNASKKLWDEASRFFNFVSKTNPNLNLDEVADWSLLNRFSKPTAAVSGASAGRQGPSGEGSAYSLKNKKVPALEGELGKPAGNLDGSKTPRFPGVMQDDLAAPFSDYIDFRHTRWSDFDASALNAPYVKLRDMLRVPGKRMAQAMFAGNRVSQEDLEMSLAKKLGKSPVGYDPELGVMTQKGGQLTPIFNQKQRSQIALSAAPLNQYQRFLNDLGSQLHSIMKDWVSDTDASVDEIDNLQQFYNQWQRAIGKQLQDLKR